MRPRRTGKPGSERFEGGVAQLHRLRAPLHRSAHVRPRDRSRRRVLAGARVGILVISFTDIRSLPYLATHWVGLENYQTFFSSASSPTTCRSAQHVRVRDRRDDLPEPDRPAHRGAAQPAAPGRNLARAVVFLPTILGVTVIGLIFSLIFNPSAGPAARVWAAFGASSAFFGDPKLAMTLVIFVQSGAGSGWLW